MGERERERKRDKERERERDKERERERERERDHDLGCVYFSFFLSLHNYDMITCLDGCP